jgi:hypothetical protein
MKLTIFSIALVTLGVATAAEPDALTAEEKAVGWKLLFDGKTTQGWLGLGKADFPSKGWVVEGGTLKHIAGGGGGDIVTEEHFDDFELAWEWKVAPKANGGLKYNLPDPKKPLGCEYQMIDDVGHPDGQRGGRLHQTASLYDVLEPAADKKLRPPGEWNTSRIVVAGNHVEHWLNGAKTVEFEFGGEALKTAIAKSKFKEVKGWGVKTKSPILLQDHHDEYAVRSMKIRRLGL